MNTKPLQGGGKIRFSGIEALRIVAMSMIVIGHFLSHSCDGANLNVVAKESLNMSCICGVDLFFLISGYFGVKFSPSKLIRLSLTLLFFGIINLLLLYAVHSLSLKTMVRVLMYSPIGGAYWFMKAYFLLMVSVPLLNAGLQTLPRKQLATCLVLFLAIIIYRVDNPAAYNYLNAAIIYCVGFYIREYNPFARIRTRHLIMLFIAGVAWGVFQNTLKILYHIPFWNVAHYDSLCVIVASIALFTIFTRLKFRNSAVNSIAAASVGCYLLQDGAFGYGWLYGTQNSFLHSHSQIATIFMFAISFIGFWIISWLLTGFMNKWIGTVTHSIKSFLHKKLFARAI